MWGYPGHVCIIAVYGVSRHVGDVCVLKHLGVLVDSCTGAQRLSLSADTQDSSDEGIVAYQQCDVASCLNRGLEVPSHE